MKKFTIYLAIFLVGNLAPWFVFWCGGWPMFSIYSAAAAFSGLVVGGALTFIHGIGSGDISI